VGNFGRAFPETPLVVSLKSQFVCLHDSSSIPLDYYSIAADVNTACAHPYIADAAAGENSLLGQLLLLLP
jgi:hypothetical protein